MSRVPIGASAYGGMPYGPTVLGRYDGVPLHQGISAQLIADKWRLPRQAMDEFSLRSHAVAGIKLTARTQVAMAVVEYSILAGFAVAGLALVLGHAPGTFPVTTGWFALSGIGGRGSIPAGLLAAVYIYSRGESVPARPCQKENAAKHPPLTASPAPWPGSVSQSRRVVSSRARTRASARVSTRCRR